MNTITLLILGAIIAILTIVILGVCYYYGMLVHKFSKVQKENLYLRYHMQEKSLGKINEAREKAMKIVQDAALQADEILKKTQVFQTDTSQNLQQELHELTAKQKEALLKASEQLSSSFAESIKQLEDEDINLFKNASKGIEEATLKEVEEFKTHLTADTVGSQKKVDDKVQEAFHQALEDVEGYKAQRLKTIDDELFRILSDVTKEIIGKRLSYDDQKELLTHSLAKVKQEINAVV